jgi:hypothetical protein
MRANTTVIFDLPGDLDAFIEGMTRLTDEMENPRIWLARVTEQDRDGTPGYIALTISGELRKGTVDGS